MGGAVISTPASTISPRSRAYTQPSLPLLQKKTRAGKGGVDIGGEEDNEKVEVTSPVRLSYSTARRVQTINLPLTSSQQPSQQQPPESAIAAAATVSLLPGLAPANSHSSMGLSSSTNSSLDLLPQSTAQQQQKTHHQPMSISPSSPDDAKVELERRGLILPPVTAAVAPSPNRSFKKALPVAASPTATKTPRLLIPVLNFTHENLFLSDMDGIKKSFYDFLWNQISHLRNPLPATTNATANVPAGANPTPSSPPLSVSSPVNPPTSLIIEALPPPLPQTLSEWLNHLMLRKLQPLDIYDTIFADYHVLITNTGGENDAQTKAMILTQLKTREVSTYSSSYHQQSRGGNEDGISSEGLLLRNDYLTINFMKDLVLLISWNLFLQTPEGKIRIQTFLEKRRSSLTVTAGNLIRNSLGSLLFDRLEDSEKSAFKSERGLFFSSAPATPTPSRKSKRAVSGGNESDFFINDYNVNVTSSPTVIHSPSKKMILNNSSIISPSPFLPPPSSQFSSNNPKKTPEEIVPNQQQEMEQQTTPIKAFPKPLINPNRFDMTPVSNQTPSESQTQSATSKSSTPLIFPPLATGIPPSHQQITTKLTKVDQERLNAILTHFDNMKNILNSFNADFQNYYQKGQWLSTNAFFQNINQLAVPIALAAINENNNSSSFVFINKAFEMTTRFNSQDILQKDFPNVLIGTQTEKGQLEKLLHSLHLGLSCKIAITMNRKDGSPFFNFLSMIPLINHQGEYKYVLMKFYDTYKPNANLREIKYCEEVLYLLAMALKGC